MRRDGNCVTHSLNRGVHTWLVVGRGDATVGTWAESVNTNYFYQIIPWWRAGGKGVGQKKERGWKRDQGLVEKF